MRQHELSDVRRACRGEDSADFVDTFGGSLENGGVLTKDSSLSRMLGRK